MIDLCEDMERDQNVPFKVLRLEAVLTQSITNDGTPKSCRNAIALFSCSTTYRFSGTKATVRLRATLHKSNRSPKINSGAHHEAALKGNRPAAALLIDVEGAACC